MKTVLVLGNGFDLNLHRKTSYRDFWGSPHCPKEYPAPLIAHLNEKWNGNTEAVKWYDLENELLNYVREINGARYEIRSYDIVTPAEQKLLRKHQDLDGAWIGDFGQDSEVIRCLADKRFIKIDPSGTIHTHRDDYDEFRLSAIERDKKALAKIKDGLCKYLLELKDDGKEMDGAVAPAVLRAVCERIKAGDDVSAYTFNYTDLPYGYENELKPQYIHGSCRAGNIIIGTKDSKELGQAYDFMQKSLDPNFNTPPVVYDLLYADEIIFFGHSLGMNDSQYLRPFFMQQTNIENPKRKNITIFTKDDSSVIEIKRAIQDMTDYNLSLLNALNNLHIIKTDGITKNFHEFKEFLDRLVEDKTLIRALLGGLKENQ